MHPTPTVPLRHILPGLVRDPLATFAAIGARSGGRVVRLHLGLTRPYLVTRPEHVQHVLRDHPEVYRREGMMWRPLRRIFGTGLGGEGAPWRPRRDLVAPLFSARHLDALSATMAGAVEEALDDLDGRLTTGQPVDAVEEMTRVVHRVLIRVFFGDRIDPAGAARLGAAIATAFTSIGARMLLPWLPERVPAPGDRAFHRAMSTVDDILLPVVRAGRGSPADDVITRLGRRPDGDRPAPSDRQVRDDVVALFAGGTETTAVALTWLWVVLDREPSIVDRIRAEGPAYTRLVLKELLRLYPVGWIVPRTAARPDGLDGVRIPAGATVLLSPYLTQRDPDLWERPEVFDPSRFAPGSDATRHRYAWFPFSGGAHQCLGGHLFTMEGALIAAAMLRRYRPRLLGPPPRPRAAVTLRPATPVRLVLDPFTGPSNR